MNKKKMRNVVRNTCAGRRKISLLNDLKIRKRFEEKVIQLVDVAMPNLCGHYKDGILEACDEVCGKQRGMRCKGSAWWLNEEVKEAVS